jgi:hypothetical protein
MLTRVRAARFLTDFDSSVNTVRATARFLHGKDHPAMSIGPSSRTLGKVAVAPPDRVRAAIYRVMGFAQGIPLDQARHLNVDDLDEWAVRQYGKGPFPAVVIGSASGGVLHLAAALRAPFLPQTTLSAVRDLATQSDDAAGAMAALAPTTTLIAGNNPRVSVYHMHDPAQDRPMLEGMAYMRLKRLQLGHPYARFLKEHLAPGGTIIQVECTRDWRVRPVGERAYFQFGCLGGLSEEEYHEPGERVARYLQQERAPVDAWEPPEMTERRPEAEWGWDPELSKDITRFAEEHGFPVRRLVSGEPQDHSPFVADLHRWWYGQLERPTNRLLVESYVQCDPMWTLRTGSIPFWLRFNMEPDYEALKSYLDTTTPYDYIHLNLFSQGVESPGVVPIERWEELLQQHARQRGELIGVDRQAYPMDLGSTTRYREAIRSIPSRAPMPGPLTVTEVDRFLAEAPAHYQISWGGQPVRSDSVPGD